jgi:UDP-N-acetylmuramoyl-L-alanyl-D-glutamate--2,6-diaminopimelate ligase
MNQRVVLPSTFPVTCHTDFVGQNSCFVAIEGYTDNGIKYIKTAIEKGARTIVVHHSSLLDDELCTFVHAHNVVIERVDNTRKALAELSAQAAGFPAEKLKIIGITGTKGKTTTSFLLEHILTVAGYSTALISSAKNRICGNDFPAPLTTPQPDYLQQFLKLCVDNNVDYVVMEVAAQALTLHRVEGIMFCGVIFTNFSHEHLEFYPTLDDYFNAKRLIFSKVTEDAPILINADNEHGQYLLDQHKEAFAYGFDTREEINSLYDYHGTFLTDPTQLIEVGIQYQDAQGECYGCDDVVCPILFGAYNAYNVLAAASMAQELYVHPGIVKRALQTFPGVPGRLQEHVLPNGARCFIDYAHNPESFKQVLSTLRALTEQLIVVFGAGGGRDKLKRPIMGNVASQIADILIITSDNPRLEDPVAIAQDIMCGIAQESHHKIVQELDRKCAIELAYQLSDNGSIIVLLGKGPDEYQIIGTTKHYFSERQIVEQL